MKSKKKAPQRPRIIAYLDNDVKGYIDADMEFNRFEASEYARQVFIKMMRNGITLQNMQAGNTG